MTSNRILITGMSGLIGGVVRDHLQHKYELTALNRRDVPGVRCVQADISDLDAILPAFENQDVVVHMAAIVSGSAGWDDVLRYNIVGTYNVFEAARRAGVKRIVFASSGSTISGYERLAPYDAIVESRYEAVPETWEHFDHDVPSRPSGLYACSKVWGETLARHVVDTSNLSIICLRIGAVNAEDRPRNSREFSVWCSQRDIAQMVQKTIEAPDTLKYDIFYVVSNNKWRYRDLSHAKEVVGFVPEDAAEDYRQT